MLFQIYLCFSFLTFFSVYSEEILNIPKLLQQMTDQEKEKLEVFLKKLIIDEDFGYTLFGEKPAVFHSFRKKNTLNAPISAVWMQEGWCVWEKHRHLFPSRRFILDSYNEENQQIIFLVNKLHSTAPSAEKISHLIKNCTTSPENHKFLGIFLGFGTHNSARFARYGEIIDSLKLLPNFPRAIPSAYDRLSEDMKNMLFYQRVHADITPDNNKESDINAVIEEIEHLFREWKSFSQIYPSGPMTLIRLPAFAADEHSPETKELFQSYAKTRAELTELVQKPDFLEIILNRYCHGL